MLQFLESKLYSDVEGTCSGQFGYIIAVVSILDIGKGMVLSGSGQAEFITRYRAIVFKPFKGEVVDGVVNNVNKVRMIDVLQREVDWTCSSDGFLRRRGTFGGIRITSSGRICLSITWTRTDRSVAHPSRHEVRPKFESTIICIRRSGRCCEES